jgi:enoyl-CoA hydratase/carnithine racemase
MTTAEPLYLETRDRVAEIVLNRPAKLNAIGHDTLTALEACLDQVESDRGIRALIIRGEGRAFCAGADLTSVSDNVADLRVLAEFMAYWHRVFRRLAESPVPSIAAVHGIAFAGGFELMQACDFAVVTDDARLGDQHANYGLFPGGGGSQLLPRLIGERRAKWLILSGETIDPREALAAGLVNAVCPADAYLERAREMAATLASKSPVGIAGMKQAIRLGLAAGSLDSALELERLLVVRHMASKDAQIGLAAFASRTVPEFLGE